MAQILLLNPAKPRKAKGAKMAKKTRSAAQRRATANLVRMNKARRNGSAKRRVSRKRSPVITVMANPRKRRSYRRRSNPIRVHRRRRNPISMGSGGSVIGMLKDAAIGGVGALVIDTAYNQVSKYLPDSLTGTAGQIDQGDAVKALFTIAAGKLLNKATRGQSVKAAKASLMIQAYTMLQTLVPNSLQMGYASPGRIVDGNNRVGPNVRSSVQRFVPGATPLLSKYVGPGSSPLLNGAGIQNRMAREGFNIR